MSKLAELKYIDIHCQLNYPEFTADLDETVRRAQDAGVGMIIVGTDREMSIRAVEIAEKHENVWAIIGLHPIHAHEEEFDRDFYLELAGRPKVVGIGECGYDYFRTDAEAKASWGVSQQEAQHEAFTAQIDIANKVGKPLMLHLRNDPSASGTRSAYSDALQTLKTHGGGVKVAGDAHFFAGTLEEAKAFIELGFSLSFTGVITFARNYDELVRAVPADKIMSETDAPFVAPAPYRGKRNEPAYVIEIANKIAEIRGAVSVEEREVVLRQLVDNARRMFSI
jgi:TatD DNase family protein